MDALLDIIPYVVIAYASFKIGKHWAVWQISSNIADHPDHILKVLERIKELDKESNSEGTEMTIERVGDQLYAYAKDTGQFLAQAGTLADLTQRVSERFPDQTFFGTISRDDPAKELVK